MPGGNWLGFFKDRYVQAAMRSDGSFYTYSDKRFKKNIESVGSVLSNVLKLNAVEYNSIYDTASLNKSMGFLAQEVQQLFPELVGQLSQGDDPKLGLNYAGFGVLAIKAIQEQQQEIEELKERLDRLEHGQ